ncbi:hypothetical protein AWENTII_005009 [Aspergillus wentii]
MESKENITSDPPAILLHSPESEVKRIDLLPEENTDESVTDDTIEPVVKSSTPDVAERVGEPHAFRDAPEQVGGPLSPQDSPDQVDKFSTPRDPSEQLDGPPTLLGIPKPVDELSSLCVTSKQQKGPSFLFWMNKLRPNRSPPHPPQKVVEGWPDLDPLSAEFYNNNGPSSYGTQEQHWEHDSEHSSHLGTVKTATMSIASLVRSRRTTRSTTKSTGSDIRGSMESSRQVISPSIDEAAHNRAIKRWQVLREIITTESDYVCGLTALSEVLYLFPTRPNVYRNIERICEIHEKFLAELQKAMPQSDSMRTSSANLATRGSIMDFRGPRNEQNRSLRSRTLRGLFNAQLKAETASPYKALDVANKIGKLSASFAAYEEFCGNYELLAQDVAFLRQSVPDWQFYDQGIEALSKSAASINNRILDDNKSMTLSDLLIKRVCKYPLLLQDLLKHTPISDCPTSHYGIGEALENIKGPVNCINSAAGNPIVKDRIQKTILLQERLGFPESETLNDVYKQLGPMIICGVLHVTYQEPELVMGEYMVCVLFKGYFFLAKVGDDNRRLQAVACLYISDIMVEALRNGRGLHCYGLFSWKLTFSDQDDKFELILSASSAAEERQWNTEMLKAAAALTDIPKLLSLEARRYSFVALDLAPLNRAPHPGRPLARRSSTHSLAASRMKFNLQQHVVIKKTHCPYRFDEAAYQANNGEMERPKISPSPQSAWVVATKRQDRVRLEKLISEIYTRDVLPFPGLVMKKGDILFRSGEIMRRLTTRPGFTRRSSSLTLPNTTPAPDAPLLESSGNIKEDIIDSRRHDVPPEGLETDEKYVVMLEASPASTIRTKRSRQKGVPKEAPNPDIPSTNEVDRFHGAFTENTFWRSPRLTGIFNSLSRKPKKSRPSLGLGSGA